MDPESLRAALGRNAGHYLRHFERMQRAERSWLPGWNWAAFVHSTGWFWYRRMYGWALLNLVAPLLLLLLLFFVVQWFLPQGKAHWAFLAGSAGYLLAVFGLLPLYADSLYLRAPRRPPSAFTAAGALLLIAVPAALTYAAAQAQIEREHRERFIEGLSAAVSLKSPIAEFHAAQRRLPGAGEAARFRYAEPLQHAASVGWDAERRAIVVSMGERYDGGRFEIAAVEKDGALEWTCRTIELETKYLPSACR